ncbi:hypothetical protein [Psychrobacillus sp. BL-248-WT-3]|uniref:hypothetical protein n=1 Tax=Psychrobacillus sp. BL-248-WT-3 TaxID=2725306 RepID=UPI00146D6A6F|nr:hypothetical protein [Psychrobacillus sp. BL-248-WT-3]NME07084.1 hypothetical protein [Psychrobacillus sp. BL-248-WT-3]
MELFIGMGCTVLGFLVGLLTYSRNRDKDVKAEAARTAVIETKLDTISRGVEVIQREIKALETQRESLSERLTRIEEGNKLANRRIEELSLIQEVANV